jgi:hypothetical protein
MSVIKRRPGRPAGSPNKATADARQAIAQFVDGNAHRLTEWLDSVANGVKAEDPETGEERYVVPPNPAKAFDMFQSVVEYHIPKLARTELAGDRENPLEVDVHMNVFGELLKAIRMDRQSKAYGEK